jgi:hypothetical protein
MIKDIKTKLKNALDLNIKKITEGRINGNFEKDFQILTILFIDPEIVSPNNISKDDYKNAKMISFKRAHIRIGEKKSDVISENIYYCDGSAMINYIDDDFSVDLEVSNIYDN